MKFFNKAATALEFDKIRETLAETAFTEGAGELARRLEPSSDIETVRKRQRHTTDAVHLVCIKGLPSFGNVKDVRPSAERAGKGAMLSPKELLEVASLLRTARGLVDYNRGERDFESSLDEIFARLFANRSLEDAITRAIVSEDMIADEASPALSDIRRKMRAVGSRIRDVLQKYISGATQSKYLQENIVTVRSGRYVIPVKAEYRNEVKGLIHDTSSSGATLFIEPMAVVEANNELRELTASEEHEIERILFELSARVGDGESSLALDYLNVTELAFIFTCAAMSLRMNATPPTVSDRQEIKLKNARHPLLDQSKVVPMSVGIGGDEKYTMLIITGPNTGGKTVALKTVGLFAMMAQAGLHIPAEGNSVLGVFDEIFADIGDEQSIEQSLSTFSSHMVGIVSTVGSMTDRSLVLFDELGAGTDPVEGAALAMAILEDARQSGAICAATTHYAELKAYALETEGVVNAACEFDVNTLKPTYRLTVGAPGKSNAFAISEKLGLPEHIVARAQSFVDTGSRNFETVIAKLEETRYSLEAEARELAREKAEFEQFRKKGESELKRSLADAERDSEKMKNEARRLLDGAKATSNFVFEQLDEVKRQKESENFAGRLAETKRAVRGSVRELDDQLDPVLGDPDDGEDYKLPRPLVKGDQVRHRGLGQNGELLDDPDKNGNCTVKLGSVKTRANVKELRLVEKDKKAEKRKKENEAAAYRLNISRSFSLELDVRGQTGDDAWFMVDKYLDDAKIAGVKQATLIHGKGTGALRAAIWAQLKKDSRVDGFRAGTWGEGDFGVTVVTLK